jgi:hypothetical protein
MRIGALSTAVVATLVLGAGPVLAFEETTEAPPVVLQVAPDAKDPAMQLQSPAPAQPPAPSTEKSGTKLFGFSLLPKLDFGLELLYSEPQAMDLQQGTPSSRDNNDDLTVLGKLKRQF